MLRPRHCGPSCARACANLATSRGETLNLRFDRQTESWICCLGSLRSWWLLRLLEHTDPLKRRRTTWLLTDVPTLSPTVMHVRQTVQCCIRSASAPGTSANLSLGCLMVIRR